MGIMAAIRQRDASGKGCTIDASLYETAIAWMTYHAAAFDASGDIPKAAGSGMNAIVPYQAYECTDGYLVVAAGGDSLFVRLSRSSAIQNGPKIRVSQQTPTAFKIETR